MRDILLWAELPHHRHLDYPRRKAAARSGRSSSIPCSLIDRRLSRGLSVSVFMREILHAELLPHGLDAVVSGEGRWPAEVRGLMELEFEVALRNHSPLAVLCVSVDDIPRLALAVAGVSASAGGDAVLSGVAALVRRLPRSGDLLALRDKDRIVAMLTSTDAAGAETFARQLIEGSKRVDVPGAPVPLDARVSIGLAFAQFEVGAWFETILAVAEEGVDVAAGAGGGRAVHTELYRLHQRRLERENPERPKPVLHPPPARTEATWQSAAPVRTAPPVPPQPAPVDHAAAAQVSAPERARAPAGLPSVTRPDLRDLEDKVLTLAREWAQEALVKSLAEQKKAHSSEVDVLERRILKLTRALEDAQADLERAQQGAETDPGVASAYRAVQGLRGERDVAKKLDMLAKIVEMNLALRRQLATHGADPAAPAR